jgi:hypothetical protein
MLMESELEHRPDDPGGLAPGKLGLLWLVVIVELLAPVPAILSLGAIYVLLTRPRWFLDLVLGLYGRSE